MFKKLIICILGMKGLFVLAQNLETAVFAGGCFWCAEHIFQELKGVRSVTSGYMGGKIPHPTYQQVSGGKTQHLEVVQVIFDPKEISYKELLSVFWKNVNPTDEGGQFVDRGEQYKTAIFYFNSYQQKQAELSKVELEKQQVFKNKIVTQIRPAKNFYKAESYHQDFYKKNPVKYNTYKKATGRDKFLKQVWKDSHQKEKGALGLSFVLHLLKKIKNKMPSSKDVKKASLKKNSQKDLKSRLTSLQYYVTQHEGTEPAFQNKYWNHKEEGIYVDVTTGKALFSSLDKYDSGTGWPSFTKPIDGAAVQTKKDFKLLVPRIEVKTKTAHLGHVFPDRPKDRGGKRYCINSASLKFISRKDLKKEGYAEYEALFQKQEQEALRQKASVDKEN